MMIILDRRFTVLQWIALFMSLTGAVTVQFGGHAVHEHHHVANSTSISSGVSDQVAGLSAVLIMCLTNAFGGQFNHTNHDNSTI